MLSRLLVAWVLLAGAFALTSWLLSGMTVSGGVGSYLWVSALFGFVNATIGTILRIVTTPLRVLTLGLFSFVVSAIVLKITDALTSRLTIDSFFWTAIWAAVVLAVVTVVLDLGAGILMRPKKS